MERLLEIIAKWLKGSWLAFNKDKTEICLFYKHKLKPVMVTVHGTQTKDVINVLGVKFDTRIQWSHHVASTVKKVNHTLSAKK